MTDTEFPPEVVAAYADLWEAVWLVLAIHRGPDRYDLLAAEARAAFNDMIAIEEPDLIVLHVREALTWADSGPALLTEAERDAAMIPPVALAAMVRLGIIPMPPDPRATAEEQP